MRLLDLTSLFVFFSVPLASMCAEPPENETVDVTVDPVTVSLSGPNSRFTLLVEDKTKSGQLIDLTRRATFRSKSPDVVTVSPTGVVRSLSDGQAQIEITAADKVQTVFVSVRDFAVSKKFNFENDIIPLFTRFGCNNSGCHGKAEGQNGFKLSVFGFDPQADYAALTKESRGRRVNPATPKKSLLLAKASGDVPHGGGVRIRKGSGDYRILRDWILAGLPFGDESDPKVTSIEVTPRERQLPLRSKQQLRVVATFSDGHRVDVTGWAKFQSNNEGLGQVDEFGLLTNGEVPGEVAIMASYMGAVDVFRALTPNEDRIDNYPKLPENNFIDRLVHRKLKKLHILPSGEATDAEFTRRVYLDIIGTLPITDDRGHPVIGETKISVVAE